MFRRVFNKIRKAIYVVVVGFVIGVFFVGQAQAATMYLSASDNQIKIGELVTVRALVNTQTKTINNAEAALIFNKDLVEVISLSTSRSIFSLWVEQPNFSNSSGRVAFNGGLPNPGFTGTGGEIVSVTFRAKSAGTASFSFAGAAIRENDGLGTDILTGQGNVSVTILSDNTESQPETPKPEEEEAPEEETEEEVSTNVNGVPTITSTTYPDQNGWYSSKAGLVSWQLPVGATTVQTLLGYFPNSTPSISYTPPIYQKQINNLDDGVWYFHLRYQKNGKWSDIAHYRIQIDSEAPTDLTVEPIQSETGISLKLSAQDSRSGVDYYSIVIGDQETIKIDTEQAKAPIVLPVLKLGDNQIAVAVYDKAGNYSETTLSITTEPLVAPIIDTYPEKIGLGDTMTISGSSIYAQSKIKINIKSATGELMSFDALTDIQGKFSFTSTPLNTAANYQVWAYLINDQGQMTPDSAKVNVLVEAGVFQNNFNTNTISLTTILLVVVIILVLGIIGYGSYLIIVLRRRLSEVEKRSMHNFHSLITNAHKQITALNKYRKRRKLSAEESRALDELTETIKEINEMKNTKVR